MPTRFTRLDALVPFAKRRALRGFYTGKATPSNMMLIRACSHLWSYDGVHHAKLIFTHDVGHHEGGWWKNPDYERCWHLSLSYADNVTNLPLPQDHGRSEVIAAAFFGEDRKLAWIEPPYSDDGIARHVWHYRVFADEGWQPIKPRGEVYSREHTPAGWKSFSEIHGWTPEPDQAPFLRAQGDAP